MVKHEIQNKWESFKQNYLEKRISKLLDDLQEIGKGQEWYSTVEKIQERFKDIYKGWWMDNYSKFRRINTCIICKKEPDCLYKYNPSKEDYKKLMVWNVQYNKLKHIYSEIKGNVSFFGLLRKYVTFFTWQIRTNPSMSNKK